MSQFASKDDLIAAQAARIAELESELEAVGAGGVQRLAAAPQAVQADVPLIARQLGEWHEDDGPVMWWAWNGMDWAGEPAWCGQPSDSDWPGYHTHWTPHPKQPEATAHPAEGVPAQAQPVPLSGDDLSDVLMSFHGYIFGDVANFVAHVEAAHGITQEKQG